MQFVLFTISALVSMAITSFTLIPILIIVRFGIPMTKNLERNERLIKGNNIIRNYFISILFLSVVYLVFFKISDGISYMIHNGFIFGTIMTILFGIGQTGKNTNNIEDYNNTNKDKFINKATDINDLDEVANMISQYDRVSISLFQSTYSLPYQESVKFADILVENKIIKRIKGKHYMFEVIKDKAK